MTINDGWAAASLRFLGPTLDLGLLHPALAKRAVLGPRGDVVVVSIDDDAESDLQHRLEALERFATQHRIALVDFRRRTGAKLQVFLGWSPMAPQESIIFASSLLGLLADQEAEVIIDSYSE